MKEFKAFKYKGRWVVGMKSMTKLQYWITYGYMWAWIATALYVIVKNAMCDCLYLTAATQWPVFIVTIFVFLWTYFARKQVNRLNYIYEDDEIIK